MEDALYPTGTAAVRVTSEDRAAHQTPSRTATSTTAPTWRGAQLSAALLAGLTLWLVFGGRWASYLGHPQSSVYATDVVLGVALAISLLALTTPRPLLRRVATAPWLWRLCVLLLAWAVARLLIDFSTSRDALRDFAPYAYVVVAVVVGVVGVPWRRPWPALVITALVGHAIWVSAEVFHSSLIPHPHIYADTWWFSARPDFDSMVCGVAAVIGLRVAWIHGPILQRVLAGLFAVWNALLVGEIYARSPLVAALVLGGFAVLFRPPHPPHLPKHRPWVVWTTRVVVAAVAVAVVASAIFATTAGRRLRESIGTGTEATAKTNVRVNAYGDVVRYVDADAKRVAIGVGFGPDFLYVSGGRAAIGADATLRSPHDYEVGTYARLGVPGVLLTLGITLLGLLAAARLLRHPTTLLDDLAAFLLVGIPVIAAMGVVLESPFGAIPYFFAVGHVCRRLTERSETAVDQAVRFSAVTPVARGS